MEVTKRAQLHSQARAMIQRWFQKNYNLQHSSYGYIGMFGVWDVMGDHNLDRQVFVSGSTKHLIEMRDMLVKTIDEELERRRAEANTG